MIATQELLTGSPYQGYSYAYPHKTAYRPVQPALPLAEAWAAEPRDSLFLYLHVPFCEFRCGFCNLFTQAQPRQTLVQDYLAALERQAGRVALALGDSKFARCAIGGGTPTQLEIGALARLFDVAGRIMGADLRAIPVSIEASPETTTPERLSLLHERGVTRLSLGVQSFNEAEVHAVGRPQKTGQVLAALESIRAAGLPVLNVDLIYGLAGQSVATWLDSIEQTLRFRPEEIYLYPLYVRPLTGLGRSERDWNDIRLQCYREGRARLLDEGYQQVSMRMFRAEHAPAENGPVYCCQEDGMVGLGCGARSYTRGLHCSSEYAVGASGVRAILAAYVARSGRDFDVIDFGFALDGDEQRRRYLIQSLLTVEGLDTRAYARRFGSLPAEDYPELHELVGLGLAEGGERWQLTAPGLERSDVIGPWLYSPRVRHLMEEYAWR
ncbi:MAG: STM4012 family radical SAM protein [Gemmataceae bacterium]